MRWLKHPSGFCHSTAMSEVRDAFGFAGYGAVWILLERIAEAWNGQGEPCEMTVLMQWTSRAFFKFKIVGTGGNAGGRKLHIRNRWI
jgi:hypothetical protein